MRGVIFDLDDTLYSADQFRSSGFAAVGRLVARRFGVSEMRAAAILEAARASSPGRELQVLREKLALPPRLVATLLQEYRMHHPALSLADGASELLRRLVHDGWRVGILTNGLPHVQASKVEALRLHHRVHAVVYAENCVRGGKPHPAAFRQAVRRLAVPANRCVMVGNDPECDVRGARDAGLHTIHLLAGHDAVTSVAEGVVASLRSVAAVAAALVPEECHRAA
jgi:putative hydrolase of the HAD superfamily